MKFTLRNAIVGLAAASMLAVSVPAPAQATHKIGHLVAAGAVGFLLGNAFAKSQPSYVVGQPNYVVQPRYCWVSKQVWDPYLQAYVIVREQQLC